MGLESIGSIKFKNDIGGNLILFYFISQPDKCTVWISVQLEQKRRIIYFSYT